MALGGALLRTLLTTTLFLAFLASALILGIMSYFMSSLSTHHRPISNRLRAIEGISGAATLYTLLATVLACFLGGVSGFAIVAAVLDALFVGGMVAVAVMLGGSAGANCSGSRVSSFLGNGQSNAHVYGANNGAGGTLVGIACRLQKAMFGAAIAGIGLFLLALLYQILLRAHHRREKAFGPSPANNYTSGRSGRRAGFFSRRKRRDNLPDPDHHHHDGHREAELGVVGAGAGLAAEKHHHDHDHQHNGHAGLGGGRHSVETGYTGTTAETSPTTTTTAQHETAPHAGHYPPRAATPTGGYAGDRASYATSGGVSSTGGAGAGYAHPATTMGGYGREYGRSGVPAERGGHAFMGPGGSYGENPGRGANF